MYFFSQISNENKKDNILLENVMNLFEKNVKMFMFIIICDN